MSPEARLWGTATPTTLSLARACCTLATIQTSPCWPGVELPRKYAAALFAPGAKAEMGQIEHSGPLRHMEELRHERAQYGLRLGPTPQCRYVHDMCGRVRLSSDVSEIKLVFSIPPERPTPNFPPSWNVAPTDTLPVVRYDTKAEQRSLDMLR